MHRLLCAGNTDRRDTVRATWGNVVWREKISALYNATYQILFIVGMLGYLMFRDLKGISYANRRSRLYNLPVLL